MWCMYNIHIYMYPCPQFMLTKICLMAYRSSHNIVLMWLIYKHGIKKKPPQRLLTVLTLQDWLQCHMYSLEPEDAHIALE